MRKIIAGIFLLLTSGMVYSTGKDTIASKYGETITAQDLSKHLHIIASDEYEGRETGKEGQKKTAEYIKQSFKNSGLTAGNKGSYFQEFNLVIQDPKGVKISVNGKDFEFLRDFYYFPGFKDTVININEVTFLGYGISDKKYNDYKDADVNGKVVMVLNGEPVNKKAKSFLTGKKEMSSWTSNRRKKAEFARDNGASALLIVVNNAEENINKLRHFIESPSMKLDKPGRQQEKGLPCFYISREMADVILNSKEGRKKTADYIKEIDHKGRPQSAIINSAINIDINRESKKITSENVLGYVEGTDLKDELIVITAHYDHLGIHDGVVYNGADDDGSGTVAVMELAEAFGKAKKEGNGPRRSILFMPVSGEEKGLLGSEYYTENPVYSLEGTVSNLNIDMIGRVDSKHEGNFNYLYLIGSDKLSTELHKISEQANATYTNMELDYTFNKPNDPNRFYYRSDHYNFAKNNIPVIFYFNGVHPDYHKATDTVEKINFEAMEIRTRLVFYTAWDLANRKDRIKVDVESDFKNNR